MNSQGDYIYIYLYDYMYISYACLSWCQIDVGVGVCATLPPRQVVIVFVGRIQAVEMQVQMCIPSVIYNKSTFSNRGCPASGGFWDNRHRQYRHFLGEVDHPSGQGNDRVKYAKIPQIPGGARRPTFNERKSAPGALRAMRK